MIMATICLAINDNDIRSGHLTLNTLKGMFNICVYLFIYITNIFMLYNLQEKLKSHSENIGLLLHHERGAINPALVRPLPPVVANANNLQQVLYSYSERFWSIPEGFVLPKKANVSQAFTYWFSGIPEYQIPGSGDNEATRCPIIPFRNIKLDMLPKVIRQTFCLDYLPSMKLMKKYLESENICESPSRDTLKEWLKSAYGD